MDFFENVNIKYNGLTKHGKKIVDYIVANREQAVKMTAKVLGENSGTSASAVVRLYCQLGYESLEGMKLHLARSLQKDEFSMPIDTMISSEDTLPELCNKLYGNVNKAFQDTIAGLSYDDLKNAISILKNAQTVYIFGIGGSGLAANDFHHKLSRINRRCTYNSDGHTNLEYAPLATPKDAMLVISYSGDTKEVLYAAREGRKNGVPVICITKDRLSALSMASDIVLTVPEVEKRVRIGTISARFAQMFLTDILYLGIIQKNFDEIEDFLRNTSSITNLLRE